MKDYELQMLTAFFAALTQQSEPLPADFVVQLNEISETLDLNQLNQLITNSSLGENYQIAYQRLRSKSSVRNLGLDTTPNDKSEVENTTCTETDNAASRGTEQNSDEIITQIETRLYEEETPTSLIRTICGNFNPIEAAQTIFLTSGF
jgi:non-ribosomal peptide synthetase component E (peptide arylation enzyme)